MGEELFSLQRIKETKQKKIKQTKKETKKIKITHVAFQKNDSLLKSKNKTASIGL